MKKKSVDSVVSKKQYVKDYEWDYIYFDENGKIEEVGSFTHNGKQFKKD